MSKDRVFIQFQLVIMTSAPSVRKIKSGKRLTKKASLTAFLTWDRAQFVLRGLGCMVDSTGYARIAKMMSRLDVIASEVGCIATTWICTKSFWFLRPTDELLSFSSS